MRIPELPEILLMNGYDEEDIAEIESAYLSGGLEAAVNAFKWADDAEHDYGGELRRVILKWQTKKDEIETIAKAFLEIERADPKVSEVFIPNNKDGDKIVEDLKNWLKEVGEVEDDTEFKKEFRKVFAPRDKKEMWMDDVSTISLAAMKTIEDGLKEFGITLTDEQEDEIYVPMLEKLEKFSNCNYRHEH